MSSSYAEEASVVSDNRSTEFGDTVAKVHQIFTLFVRSDIIKVDILVSPFKVMDDAFIRQLFLHDENILEEIDDPLFDVKVVEFGNHSLLILQSLLVLSDECIALVNFISDVIKQI